MINNSKYRRRVINGTADIKPTDVQMKEMERQYTNNLSKSELGAYVAEQQAQVAERQKIEAMPPEQRQQYFQQQMTRRNIQMIKNTTPEQRVQFRRERMQRGPGRGGPPTNRRRVASGDRRRRRVGSRRSSPGRWAP